MLCTTYNLSKLNVKFIFDLNNNQLLLWLYSFHSCTVEDAAIYQASAINSKGIVSCSGVLEVGEMNEFKIHQRYFAKLTQKVENTCKEAQDKENQEYLRTVSPSLTQRKCRSTTEAFLSMSSPSEDDHDEGSPQAEPPEVEVRLQEATVEEPDKNTAPVSDGTVSALTSGQRNNDKDNKSRTDVYDPAQNTFTSYQPKSPFVKKKIKVSNSAKIPKADIMVEKMSRERTTKDETSSSMTPGCTETNGISAEATDVENVCSPVLHLESKYIKEKHKKSPTEKAEQNKSSSKNESLHNQATVFSKRQNLTKTVSPVAKASGHTLSENDCKQKAKPETKGGHRETENHLEMKNQSPCIISTQKQSLKPTDLSMLKKVSHAAERVTTTDTNRKSKTPSDKRLGHSGSAGTSCDSRTALPPYEVAESPLSEKETSSCQKAESQPDTPCEVSKPFCMSSWLLLCDASTGPTSALLLILAFTSMPCVG